MFFAFGAIRCTMVKMPAPLASQSAFCQRRPPMNSPTVPETRAARLRKLFLATLYPVGGRFCTADFPDTKRKRSLTFVSDLGAPEETRTPDLLIRSQTLYPAELPALVHRVCRGTYIIIPSTSPNVKHFFKVFCKKSQKGLFSAVIRHTFSFQTPRGRILLAVLRQTSYTISVYYGFGCDFL